MSTYDQGVDIVMGHEYRAEVVDYGPGTERRIPIGALSRRDAVLAMSRGTNRASRVMRIAPPHTASASTAP
jgi:hypothetical protein